jgi:hypothetical protein
MVQQMLHLRGDCYPDYNIEQFIFVLQKHASIFQQETITASGRTLFWYKK